MYIKLKSEFKGNIIKIVCLRGRRGKRLNENSCFLQMLPLSKKNQCFKKIDLGKKSFCQLMAQE